MKTRNVSTWEEFEKGLEDVRLEYQQTGEASRLPLLFRGQENACWPLSTTLDRKRERMLFAEYYGVISKIRLQIETLTGSEWPIPEYPEVLKETRDYDAFSIKLWSRQCPAYAYMAYLRHHGFPSPLLDWTRSPYVAAFFAFNKARQASDGRISIYILGQTDFQVSGNGMPVLYRYGPYVKTHRRHVLQQSEYTLCTRFDDGKWLFEKYDAIFEPGPRQQAISWRFTLPVSERVKVIRLLDEYNLNAFSLFGSEDSLMETLAMREF